MTLFWRRKRPSRRMLIDALTLAAAEFLSHEHNTDRRTAVIQTAAWAERTR